VFCNVRLSSAGAQQAGTKQFTALELLKALGYSAEPFSQRPSWLRAKLLETNDRLRNARRLIRLGYMPRRALTQFSTSSSST
jgi:hypothetical protein